MLVSNFRILTIIYLLSLNKFKLGIFHLQLNNTMGFWVAGSLPLNIKKLKAILEGNLRSILSLSSIIKYFLKNHYLRYSEYYKDIL